MQKILPDQTVDLGC